ncbi:hypothetical protein F4802DRAFT_181456 [Xylaria palmicola]|nr:hypothetical protein F4802DRAFT_181456 [Xylaria palmicola]
MWTLPLALPRYLAQSLFGIPASHTNMRAPRRSPSGKPLAWPASLAYGARAPRPLPGILPVRPTRVISSAMLHSPHVEKFVATAHSRHGIQSTARCYVMRTGRHTAGLPNAHCFDGKAKKWKELFTGVLYDPGQVTGAERPVSGTDFTLDRF